jgi:putative membrane protein
MKGRTPFLAGVAILALAWLGPLPGLVHQSFAAHMVLHMAVIGAGVPLLALGLARARNRPEQGWPALAFAASLLDFAVVWVWHAPALHDASRSAPAVLVAEQASFAVVALALWLTALAGPPLVGAMALFLTSMHMTLLGALLGLAPRPLYAGHAAHQRNALDALTDQQIGGVIMMALGGGIYLAAATHRAALALRAPVRR